MKEIVVKAVQPNEGIDWLLVKRKENDWELEITEDCADFTIKEFKEYRKQ